MRGQLLGKVESDSRLGVQYEIRRTESGVLTCSCEAFHYSKSLPRTCKHLASFTPEEPAPRLPLIQVQPLGEHIVWKLKPYCHRGRLERRVVKLLPNDEVKDEFVSELCEFVSVAGSLRRKKADVKDVDVVASPKDLQGAISALNCLSPVQVAPQMLTLMYCGVKVKVYLASADEYVPLLLWRTGSVASNLALAQAARKRGLSMTRAGIFKGRQRIAWRTEREIFEAVGLPYKEPWQRD